MDKKKRTGSREPATENGSAHALRSPRDESWIIVLLFDRADTTGDGQDQLARWLNQQPDIPEPFKPFYGATVGYWLDNPIYLGTLRYGDKSTGIVDDTRVVEDNPDDEVMYEPDFCEPLVTREIWERVQAVREVRRQQLEESRNRNSKEQEKQIKPLAPGRTVKHLLAGLVCCADCQLAMVPQSSPVYVTKDGEERRYTSYVCPRHLAGACKNTIHVPEKWLVETVIATLRERLFPWRD